MISFIMPAKNESKFIAESINVILRSSLHEWELIVVDDASSDDTMEIVKKIAKRDKRVLIFSNPGLGKVQGLNFGYKVSRGDFVKCIDADDLLTEAFFSSLQKMTNFDASCHDLCAVSESLEPISIYHVNKSFLNNNFDSVAEYLVSLPRCVWTISRDVAEKIFPMPKELPFEDVWFSLMIKKHVPKIMYFSLPMYLYRQHSEQTYGGLLNFDKKIIRFRANRMLVLIQVLKKNWHRFEDENSTNQSRNFLQINTYFTILSSENIEWRMLFNSQLSVILIIKAILFVKCRPLLKITTKIKWLFDSKLK